MLKKHITEMATGLLLLVASALHAQTPLAPGDVAVLVSHGICCKPPSWIIFDENGVRKPGVPLIPESLPEIAPDDVATLRLKIWSMAGPARLRSGAFLVADRDMVFPRLMKFDAAGHIISVHELPYEPYLYGVGHLEVFADQCTVAWTATFMPNAGAYLNPLRPLAIRAYDICAGEPLPDLLPAASRPPYYVRQLANGDLLVVTSHEVVQFHPSGNVVASWGMIANNVALTHDGRGFWAVGHNGLGGTARLMRIDFDQPLVLRVAHPLDGPGIRIEVAGEWHAALQPAQPPARRRAVRR